MNNPAYDSGYLNSAKLSGRYLFKLIARNCSDCFGIIYKYMKRTDFTQNFPGGIIKGDSRCREGEEMEEKITVDLNAEISNTYDEFILEWMSDCYITLQWKYRLWSSEIIDIVKPEKLYKQYYPLHETSLTNAVTKIYEIYHLKDLYMHRSELLDN